MNLLTDSSVSALSVVVIVTVSIFWQIWKLIRSNKKKPCLPPGPRGLPIVGYLPYLIGSNNLHIHFAELAKKYGPIYKLRLGKKLCVVISSASLIKEVIRDHAVIFANKSCTVVDLIISYNAQDVSFCNYGAQWRMSRRIFVRELMSTDTLDAYNHVLKDEVRKEIRNVHSKIGRPVNILELVAQVTLNVILRMTWGSKYGLEKRDRTGTEFLPLLLRILELLGKPNISDFFPFLARFDIQGIEKEMNDLVQILDRVFEKCIDKSSTAKSEKEEETTNKGSKDFIDRLVELMDKEEDKIPLTRAHIKGMLLNIVGGGTSTSSTTMEWVMAELMNHPKEMEKVQKELNEVVGLNNIVKDFHIPKLEYLDAVLKEAMRLHPIGPFLTLRSSSETGIVDGFTIPKDSTIFLSAWSIHRDPLFWDNPLEFNPQRFLGNIENLDFSGHNLNYIPFGSGRRMCAGQPLATKIMKYVLASLLHSFEWEMPEGEELNMEDKFVSVLSKRNPLFVVPSARLSDSNLYV